MGIFKKLFSDAADELKKNLENSKNEMRKNMEDMKRSAMADFGFRPSSSRIVDDDDDDDNDGDEPRISIGKLEDGVLTISETFSELDGESLEEYKRLRKIVFPASLTKIDSDVICEQDKIEEVDFSKVTKLTEIPDEFIYGNHNIRQFVIPEGVKTVGDGFLGDAKAGTEIYVPASVNKLGYISGNSNNDLIVYLFAANIDIEDVEEDIKTLYVLPQYYAQYAKKLKNCDSEARLREMPEEAMSIYKAANPEPKAAIEQVQRDSCINSADCEKARTKVKEEVPATAADNDGMFSARMEMLIKSALQDGILTDKERELLKKRAEKEGEDWDEVEMIIEARLAEMKPAAPVTQAPLEKVASDKTAPDKADYGSSQTPHSNNPKQLIIPEGVKEIEQEDYAYSECEEILFPSSLEKIGDSAFMSCFKLKQIDFSRCSSLQEIEDNAFWECKKLEEIALPDSVTIIGDETFSSCEKLRKIVMPSSLEKLGDAVFWGCDSLEEVDFSKVTKLTTIPKRFETGNDKQMAIPMGVTTIRKDAFEYCNKYALFLPPTLKDYMDTNGNWESVYLFASPLEKMDNIFENCNNLYVLPQYFEKYKSIHEALGEYSWCEIHTMPDEYLYFYDN